MHVVAIDYCNTFSICRERGLSYRQANFLVVRTTFEFV
jgi:hypothetical protein